MKINQKVKNEKFDHHFKLLSFIDISIQNILPVIIKILKAPKTNRHCLSHKNQPSFHPKAYIQHNTRDANIVYKNMFITITQT